MTGKGAFFVKKVVFCFYTNDHEVNLGIGFMSAALKKEGIETELVIYRDRAGEEPDTTEGVVSRILAKSPEIVAFSAMTLNWCRIKEVISLLRESFEGPIIVGGYQAILEPEEVLSHRGVDAVCVGEGELPIIKAVVACQRGKRDLPSVEGLITRHQKGMKIDVGTRWLIDNLEDYPYLDYDIFANERKKRLEEMHTGVLSPSGVYSLPIITGRGCPYSCTYCCNSALIERYGGAKNYVRKYSPERAISNIKGIINKYGPQLIEFYDETFNRNKAWAKDFCALYGREIGLPYVIMARIDILDESTVAAMAESGLKVVLFGLESGHEEYRARYLKRRMSNETIIEGARLLRKYDVMILTFNIFGMPFETKEMISKTFELNDAIRPDAAFCTIFQPLPGTELGRLAFEHHMSCPPPEQGWDLMSSSLDTPELPAAYVVKILDEFKMRFANTDIINKYFARVQRLANSKS